MLISDTLYCCRFKEIGKVLAHCQHEIRFDQWQGRRKVGGHFFTHFLIVNRRSTYSQRGSGGPESAGMKLSYPLP